MTKHFYLLLLSALHFCLCIQAQAPLEYSFPESAPKPYRQDADLCYRLIERQAHYLLTLVKPWHGNSSYKLTTSSSGVEEHITRPNTGAVAIFSFLYRFGNYSDAIVGVSREQLLQETIIPMMRYLVSTHKTGPLTFDNGKHWGGSWQSAHWTHQLGQGACTIWKHLPSDLQQRILEVVKYEANRIAATHPPYALTYDSKSEENAWNAGAISVALMLMPEAPEVPTWEKALQRWLLSAYLCPNDANSQQMIDGKPLAEQFEGANIYNDYTLENHGLIHPDYMTACSLKGEIMIDYLATDRQMPDACMYNVDNIYRQLKTLLLPSGGFIYPTGQDWAIFRHCDWANIHAFCLFYYHDHEALFWLRKTLNVIDRMQQRHPDGRIYGENENYFPSSQTLAGLGLVDTWKMLMSAKPVKARKPKSSIEQLFPDGKFFIRRTPHSTHSIAWGSKIQIQSMATATDPIVAPDWQNGIGRIRLVSDKYSLQPKLDSIQIDTLKKGMSFRIAVRHGDAALSIINVQSNKNGELILSEKITALRPIRTARVTTMSLGILNHKSWIEEKGYRKVENSGTTRTVESMSGQSFPISGQDISIDNRLFIHTTRPFNGSYTGAKDWNSSKLVDRLILNDLNTEKEWKTGEVINENSMTIHYR